MINQNTDFSPKMSQKSTVTHEERRKREDNHNNYGFRLENSRSQQPLCEKNMPVEQTIKIFHKLLKVIFLIPTLEMCHCIIINIIIIQFLKSTPYYTAGKVR